MGIDPGRVHSFPHELSGGMRQRVAIAMALALEPELVIMDEPTTALDVVVQREILDEIERLREELGFAVIFITHDMSLLLEISDRLAVMYAGQFVEYAPAELVATAPAASRTRRACSARFPDMRGARRELRGIPGHAAGPAATISPAARSRRAATTRSSPCATVPPGCGSCPSGQGWLAACHLHDPGPTRRPPAPVRVDSLAGEIAERRA